MDIEFGHCGINRNHYLAEEEYLSTDEIAEYLSIVAEDGDAVLILAAMGDVIRGKGLPKFARRAKLRYTMLRHVASTKNKGKISFENVIKIIQALGLSLAFKTKQTIGSSKD